MHMCNTHTAGMHRHESNTPVGAPKIGCDIIRASVWYFGNFQREHSKLLWSDPRRPSIHSTSTETRQLCLLTLARCLSPPTNCKFKSISFTVSSTMWTVGRASTNDECSGGACGWAFTTTSVIGLSYRCKIGFPPNFEINSRKLDLVNFPLPPLITPSCGMWSEETLHRSIHHCSM